VIIRSGLALEKTSLGVKTWKIYKSGAINMIGIISLFSLFRKKLVIVLV
jgi:hypothetical protein